MKNAESTRKLIQAQLAECAGRDIDESKAPEPQKQNWVLSTLIFFLLKLNNG